MDSNGEVIGAIYLVANIENVYTQMKEINNIFADGNSNCVRITAILGDSAWHKRLQDQCTDMRKQALAMAKGNFSRKVKVYGDDEIGQLAMTFNSLTKKTTRCAGNDRRVKEESYLLF